MHLLAEQIGFPLAGLERAAWAPEMAGARRASLVRHVPWIVPVGMLLAAVVLLDRPWPGLLDSENEAERRAPRQLHDFGSPSITKQSRQEKLKPRPAGPGEPAESDRNDNAMAGNETNDTALDTAPPASGPGSPEPRRTTQTTANVQPRADLTTNASKMPDPPASTTTPADLMGDDPGLVEPNPAAISGNPASGNPAANSSGIRLSAGSVVAELPPPPKGLLVVGDGQKGPQRFTKLADACAAAKNGETIELRYSGPREELPLVLSDVRLVIRAGDGDRPLVRFRPSDTNPVSYPRGMIKLNGGGLRLTGLAIELDLSLAAPSENWSLFELQSVESLWFDDCSLVVRNASNQGGQSHDKVSFVRVDANPRVDMLMPGAQAAAPVQMTLRNCVALGEAVFAYNPAGQAMGLAWHNGLLATSERLIAVGGSG
ncbi:MAG: hypothetical protein ACREJM_13280, partial [Candidatus Saccharimonadales bacterium]